MLRRSARILRRYVLLQVGVVFAFWILGEAFVRGFSLPVPGGIAGFGLLFLLLSTRRLSALSLSRGSGWLLTEMLLFFVPAVLVVLDHREFLGLLGLKILCVILPSTAIVMIVTAFTVNYCHRRRSAHVPEFR